MSYEGKRNGQEIQGTWNLQGHTGAFKLWKQRQWVGHYVQDGARHEMQFDMLKFCGGKITGKGEDAVAKFDINGEIGSNGELWFTKQYHGMHELRYEGKRNYHEISGKWILTSFGDEGEFFLKKAFSDAKKDESDSE